MNSNYVRFMFGISVAGLLGIVATGVWAAQPKRVIGVVDECCQQMVDFDGNIRAVKFSLREQPGVKYEAFLNSPAEAAKMGINGLYNGLRVEITFKQKNDQRKIISIKHIKNPDK